MRIKIKKTLEWEMVDEVKEVNLGGVNFDVDVSWKKDIKLNDREDNSHDIFLMTFFHVQKAMPNSLMNVIKTQTCHATSQLFMTKLNSMMGTLMIWIGWLNNVI